MMNNKYKIKYDQESGKWWLLKKEMIHIGKLTWVIVEEFCTKQAAQEMLENE